MIRFQGMDFEIWIGASETGHILNAWRQQLAMLQPHVAYESVDRHLQRLITAIQNKACDRISLDPPDEPLQNETACKFLAKAIAQIAHDLAQAVCVYPEFPSDRKNQLIWLTWNIMFHEQLANYLFEKKISLPPFEIQLPEQDELLCRFVRHQIYDLQYKQIINDDYETHASAAEIRLESINDSIEMLSQLMQHFDLSQELVNLTIQRIQILLGLGRTKEAGEANLQAKALFANLQQSDALIKELEQVSP